MLSQKRQEEAREAIEAGKEIPEIYTTNEYEDLIEELLEMLNVQDDPEIVYPEYQVYIAPYGVKSDAWDAFVKQADQLFKTSFQTDNAWEDR